MPGEIYNDNAAAIEELFAVANEDALGFSRVKLGGIEIDAVVSEMASDEIYAAGGEAEAGGFSIILRRSQFPTKPAKYTPCSARDMELEVMDTKQHVAHWVVTIGSPVPDQG